MVIIYNVQWFIKNTKFGSNWRVNQIVKLRSIGSSIYIGIRISLALLGIDIAQRSRGLEAISAMRCARGCAKITARAFRGWALTYRCDPWRGMHTPDVRAYVTRDNAQERDARAGSRLLLDEGTRR